MFHKPLCLTRLGIDVFDHLNVKVFGAEDEVHILSIDHATPKPEEACSLDDMALKNFFLCIGTQECALMPVFCSSMGYDADPTTLNTEPAYLLHDLYVRNGDVVQLIAQRGDAVLTSRKPLRIAQPSMGSWSFQGRDHVLDVAIFSHHALVTPQGSVVRTDGMDVWIVIPPVVNPLVTLHSNIVVTMLRVKNGEMRRVRLHDLAIKVRCTIKEILSPSPKFLWHDEQWACCR
jgi:hypothetical protein